MSTARQNLADAFAPSGAALPIPIPVAGEPSERNRAPVVPIGGAGALQRCRVLVVHNRYQHRGGEDVVAAGEMDLLRRHGHAVKLYERSNDDIAALSKLDLAQQAIWSRRTESDIEAAIAAFRPDVIHAHNVFPLISPSLYWGAARQRIPVVQTLHNFRLLCPQAQLFRTGRVCEDCIGGLPWRSVLHRCYRGSAVQTSVALASTMLHRALGSYRTKVARYIALTQSGKQKFVQGGLPAERIAVKPNFVDASAPQRDLPRQGALYVGRLSAEKGLGVLLGALDLDRTLRIDIVGAGPEEERVCAHAQVNARGWLQPEAVRERLQRAAYLVMPSVWYETFGMVALEAFAAGLPVIASRLGAMEELIEHGRTGLLFEVGSALDLARTMRWAEQHPEAMRTMGENARREYEAKYTPEVNYRQLIAIYAGVMRSEHAVQRHDQLLGSNNVDTVQEF